MAESGQELTPEQLIEEFRQMKVSDLLMSTLFTLSQLAYGKLEPSARDLDQARIAIDAMRALMPVVEPALPEDARRDFGQVIANLQLAYASAASGADTSGVSGSEPQGPAAEEMPASSAGADVSNEAGGSEPQTPTGPGEAPAGDG
jgi:hypothetical protein